MDTDRALPEKRTRYCTTAGGGIRLNPAVYRYLAPGFIWNGSTDTRWRAGSTAAQYENLGKTAGL